MDASVAPCQHGLVWNSPLDHVALRALTSGGRCPVCDPSVPRDEWLAILKRLILEPGVREAVASKAKPKPDR